MPCSQYIASTSSNTSSRWSQNIVHPFLSLPSAVVTEISFCTWTLIAKFLTREATKYAVEMDRLHRMAPNTISRDVNVFAAADYCALQRVCQNAMNLDGVR